jgi:putative MFS transporter
MVEDSGKGNETSQNTVGGSADTEVIVKPTGERILKKVSSFEKRYFYFVFLLAFFGVMLGQMDAAMFSFVLPLVARDFSMPVGDVGLIVTLGFVLGAIIAFVLGPVIDRIGRKALFQITVFVTGLFSGLTAFATDLVTLITTRVGTGVGSWVEWAPGTTIIAEESLSRWRPIAIAILNLSYPMGFALSAILSYFIVPTYGWRALFYIAFVPLLIVGAFRFLAKETKRFEDLRKQRELGAQEGTYKVNLQKAKKFAMKQLLDSDLRGTTIYMIIAAFFAFYVNMSQYYGIVILTSPTAGGLSYSTALLVSFLAYAVYSAGYVMSGYIGRKWGYKKNIVYGLASAVPISIIFVFFAHGVWEWVMYPLYLLSIVGIYWPSTLNLAATIYPTRARATGVSLFLLVGGLSTALWIGLGGYLVDTIGVQLAYAVMIIPNIMSLIFWSLIANVRPTAALEEIIT